MTTLKKASEQETVNPDEDTHVFLPVFQIALLAAATVLDATCIAQTRVAGTSLAPLG